MNATASASQDATISTLQKTQQAVSDIQDKLEPVLEKLKQDDFGDATPQAQATVALSIGMMRYMGARLRGLDQGRSKDDLLRQELNKIKAVLAEIKQRRGSVKSNNTNSASTKPIGQPKDDEKKKPAAVAGEAASVAPFKTPDSVVDKKKRKQTGSDAEEVAKDVEKSTSAQGKTKKQRARK
jgi:hypothetical protein